MEERPIDFQGDIRWREGYQLPDFEHFGIWKPRKSSTPPLFYIVDWKKGKRIGPFTRQRILRAYILANAQMEAGDPQSWGLGFSVLLKDDKPVQGEPQDYIRVDPKTLSPSLALYTWSGRSTLDPPVAFDQNFNAPFSEDVMNSLLRLYEIPWQRGSFSIGALSEGRNFHVKGSPVLTASLKPGQPYAIVDSIENYPGLGS